MNVLKKVFDLLLSHKIFQFIWQKIKVIFFRLFLFFWRSFTAFVGAFVAGLLLVTLFSGVFVSHEPKMPDEIILTFDLDRGVKETKDFNLFAQLMGEAGSYDLQDVVQAIEDAAKDQRVKALVVRLNNIGFGLARTQDIRQAILKFNQTGKRSILYSDSLGGDFGNGTLEYYLASAFSEIWIQPTGQVNFTGLKVQIPYLRGSLDKLGIKPQFSERHEYKSGMSFLTQKKMTPIQKESLDGLLVSFLNQIIADVAYDRQIKEEKVLKLLDQGYFFAQDALDNHLIDRLGYSFEIDKELKESFERAENVDGAVYFFEKKKAVSDKKIALIPAIGIIMPGKSRAGHGPEDTIIGSDTLNKAILDAIEDKVDVIILRVDSPGGSYTAADSIWRHLEYAKEKGISVIASMGNYAASGGYYIAMAANKIVAQHGTITGSIGVYAGKFVTEELWKKLYVNWDGLQYGENAGMLSPMTAFTPSQKKVFEASLDQIYQDFTEKASKARNLSLKEMDKLARGRIFTGEQAFARYLVDEVGGIKKAFTLAKEQIGLTENDLASIFIYPAPKTDMEMLLEVLGTGTTRGVSLKTMLQDFFGPNGTASNGSIFSPFLLMWQRIFLQEQCLFLMPPIFFDF